jgi:protein phosphatase PTC1
LFSKTSLRRFIAQPYITITNLKDHGDAPFLILACDGVWDVLSDQEAADLIMSRYVEEGPFVDASQYLVMTAIERGSADNVTAIVVFL